jgi:O6-methylguanine-DNA--protein-cysteine methyltransferase
MEEEQKNELAQKVNDFNAPIQTNKSIVDSVIEAQKKAPMTVKEAIDLETTKTALEKGENIVANLVDKKGEELLNDAEAKKVQAETARINKETDKVKAEAQREIADLNRTRDNLQAEVETMKKQADKESAYFDANADILKCVGIRTKKTMKVMQFWLAFASVIYGVTQVIKLPITIVGSLIEGVVDIIGGICGSIKNNAIKIIVGVVVTAILVGVVFGMSWLSINVLHK